AAQPTQSASPPAASKKTRAPRVAAALAMPASRPVQLRIPSLGVRSGLIDLGLNPDRTMEVPKDPADVGWFDQSVAPGSLGPAVLAGHVTWNRAPAVFFKLATLRKGDRVEVTRKDGSTAVFAVTDVQQHPKDRFPTQAVYGTIDHAGLRLITCAGKYDGGNARYLDNIVVFAELVRARPA
ncbi:MAG: class F sortase, partial [Actinomycetota bacterium]|nr:class F sortase [Actinomycetota bacterium]